MNRQERELIEAFLNKDDTLRHERAVYLLFYKKDSLTYNFIMSALRVCFSGKQYRCQDEELYEAFLPFLYEELSRKDAAKLLSIEFLPGWLHKAATNCANHNRDKINEALGISYKKPTPEDTVVIDIDAIAAILSDDPQAKIQVTEGIGTNSNSWADTLINELISDIPNPEYQKSLRIIDLGGMSSKDYAEEVGKTVNAINAQHQEAMFALYRAAIPKIRHRMHKSYDLYREVLNSKDQAILDKFFIDGITDKHFAESYARLVKIIRRENKDK